jgi:uncharacterized OsmC-like protein
MEVSASIKSKIHLHQTVVQTNGSSKQITITPKSSGFGSSVNGAALLLLSIASCFCNDIYREADKRKIAFSGIEATVTGEFGAEVEPGSNLKYKTNMVADAPPAKINDLINYTDKIAEIHNTLRRGITISLVK